MKQGKFRLCSGTRIPTKHQVRFRCECFFIYYLLVYVVLGRFGLLSTVVSTVGFAVSILVYIIWKVVGSLGALSPVLQSSSWSESDDIVFCCVRTKHRAKILLISKTRDSSWTSRKIPSWVPMLSRTCWCFVLNRYPSLSTVVSSVRSAVSILFCWRFNSLWFGGKIAGTAIVVMAGERWQRFLVASVQTKGGCRLIRTLLLTTLSSNTTSCFGLHEYGATWNLEERNWTRVTKLR